MTPVSTTLPETQLVSDQSHAEAADTPTTMSEKTVIELETGEDTYNNQEVSFSQGAATRVPQNFQLATGESSNQAVSSHPESTCTPTTERQCGHETEEGRTSLPLVASLCHTVHACY